MLPLERDAIWSAIFIGLYNVMYVHILGWGHGKRKVLFSNLKRTPDYDGICNPGDRIVVSNQENSLNIGIKEIKWI